MHPDTRAVWALIRQAGPEGLLRSEIEAALPDATHLAKRLIRLTELRYLVQVGARAQARFKSTDKVPSEVAMAAVEARVQQATASSTSGGTDGDTEDPEAAMRREARSKTPKGVPPGVPSSIFHLGQMHLDSAAAEFADQHQAKAAPPAATAPAVAAAPAAPGPFSVPPLVIPTLNLLRAQLQARQPAERDSSMGGPVREAPTPRFELHSDDVLLIDPAGDGIEPISLSPTVTRHLFRWLDRIGGLQLSRLVGSDGAEATS